MRLRKKTRLRGKMGEVGGTEGAERKETTGQPDCRKRGRMMAGLWAISANQA
jgi:hypothetical protein